MTGDKQTNDSQNAKRDPGQSSIRSRLLAQNGSLGLQLACMRASAKGCSVCVLSSCPHARTPQCHAGCCRTVNRHNPQVRPNSKCIQNHQHILAHTKMHSNTIKYTIMELQITRKSIQYMDIHKQNKHDRTFMKMK